MVHPRQISRVFFGIIIETKWIWYFMFANNISVTVIGHYGCNEKCSDRENNVATTTLQVLRGPHVWMAPDPFRFLNRPHLGVMTICVVGLCK